MLFLHLLTALSGWLLIKRDPVQAISGWALRCNSLFCSVVSNSLDHPGNRMLVGDLHKRFQTRTLAHQLFLTWTFGHTHADTNSHITTPTVPFCVSYSAFPSSRGWSEMEGTDRRDDWPCCFPPVVGKSDCMRGKRWRRGGKVCHVGNCSMKLTLTPQYQNCSFS